jgi:hypothetical protein
MMRKFKFEAEVYESLSCLPMVARRKLDELGIKLGLEQWQLLSRGERLMICHAPIASDEETGALRLFIDELMTRHGSKLKQLPAEKRQGLKPPASVPAQLVESAQQSGIALTQDAWAGFDDDQRYVLIKLGVEKQSHKLKAALEEFVK